MAQRILVGTRKGLFQWRRDARGKWSIEHANFIGDPVTQVLAEEGGERIHAGLDHGHFGCKVFRSDNAGASYEEKPAPAYPEQPEGEQELDPYRRTPIPWSTKYIWALGGGTAHSPRLWLGTIPGGLFCSDDHGDSWEFVTSLWNHPDRKKWVGGGMDLAGIHSVCVDPRNAEHVTVGVSCGGVWRTEDGGASWAQCADGMRADYVPPDQAQSPDQQDPHCIVQCRAAPETFWCQHHNGIFKSVDGARSWTEVQVQPTAFGFPVAVHPSDPDTAWFVPAIKDESRYPPDGKMFVHRTRDGGSSFEQLRTGLPQEHAYDLVYRHSLDVDRTGQELALGSTTGALWFSPDGGEHFEELSTHMPPIYCVRFME